MREINKSLKQEAYEKECRLVFGLGFDGLGRFAVVPIVVAGAIEVAREVKDFPMEIKLHDGTVLAGEARMPNGGTRDVNLKLADGTKKEVESEDIAYLTAWNPKMPDSKFAMVYKDKKWMTPKAVGEHVAIFAYAADFFVGKDGTMTVSGTSISYIAFRPGEEEGTVVCSSDSSKKRARKSLMEYFADDPDLCTALDDGEIGPFDFERICEAYDPAK